MTSSSKFRGPYDVFLSFRGTDVRNNFVGHLYNALLQIGIHTFRDSEKLWKGEEISMLMEAIEESRIAIIVFSENYTFSRWCLEEVAKIMECKAQKGLTVLPVFYKVDPGEVRNGEASYAQGLKTQEPKHGKDSEKMKRWKKALLHAGSLSGWTLNDGDESELIQTIVERISTDLDKTPLLVAKHPVGIEPRMIKLKLLLNLESDDKVVMVGLWGQGGIGKTTLAKALYNATFRQFQGSCFLKNVRETSKGTRGLATLQETLLNEILLPRPNLKVSNVDGGSNQIKHRLGCKKVLLILDDVDTLSQLNALAGENNWFGNGSRIVVTTRDKQLLTCHRIDQDHVYEVEALHHNEAHELLRKHAFQTHQIKTDLADSALNYAKGLPLALEVLGSSLCDTGENVWESTLNKLSRDLDPSINDVLIVSFDGLHNNEKEIFLHIACFFKGWTKEYIKKVLDSCDLETDVGFDTLIKRSLIRIEHGSLQMHDLIQAMGMGIVKEECRDDPAKRSRLWLYDDVVDVLSRDVGDCAAKSIVLDLPEPIEICIGHDAFTKMRRLRLLILRNVRDSFRGPVYLPNALGWFEWPGCANRIPEFLGPKKLVGLDMGEGNVTRVVKQFKDFQQLKYVNFSFCESLVRIPDLSCTPNLEKLVIRNCRNMKKAHESIGYHEKLEVLILEGCSQLSGFPNVLNSKNLRCLNLVDCALVRIPDVSCAPILEELVIRNCKSMVEAHESIACHKKLEVLDLEGCSQLRDFPNVLNSKNLRRLNLVDCNESLVRIPDISCAPNLEELVIRNCKSLVETDESIACHEKLEVLDLDGCSRLRVFPKVLKSKSLQRLHLGDCKNFERFPDIQCELEGLKWIYLEGTAIKELPASIENLVSLEEMYLYDCKNLASLPSNIYKLQNMKYLTLQGCTALTGFPEYEDCGDPSMKTGLSSLRGLNLIGCNLSEVKFLDNFSCFPLLEFLMLSSDKISFLPTSINQRDHFSLLGVSDCHRLQEIPQLPPHLHSFRASNCVYLKKSEDFISSHAVVHKALNRHFQVQTPRVHISTKTVPSKQISMINRKKKKRSA